MKDILIKKDANGFSVEQNNRRADMLSFDECLGLVATLIIPDSKEGRVNLRWMLPKENENENEN